MKPYPGLPDQTDFLLRYVDIDLHPLAVPSLDPNDRSKAFEQIYLLLQNAKENYDRADKPEERRTALAGQICAVMALVNLFDAGRPGTPADGEPSPGYPLLISPLRDLLTAFLSLDSGHVEPLLQPGRVRGRPRVAADARFGAYAAAASARLMRGGWRENDADTWVSARLRSAGYRRGGNPKTIKGWRKEAREAAAETWLRATYDQVLADCQIAPEAKAAAECAESDAEVLLNVLYGLSPPPLPHVQLPAPYRWFDIIRRHAERRRGQTLESKSR